MSAARLLVRGAGLLALVAFVGVLMVLPAGAFLAGSATAGTHVGTASARGGPTVASPTNARSPSSTILSNVPASLDHIPWLASMSHHGTSTYAPLASVPNLGLLEHPVKAVDGQVSPFYVAQPAPLGLADYGLGATTYSYNVSHLMGQVTFNAPPNVTDPASTGVIEPQGAHDGYVGSEWELGIQLNTVATNMSIPGSDQGFFWTQNVVNWNDSGIHFVDDTFNLTSATQSPFVIQQGTLYRACNNGSAGIDRVLFNYGGVFQCVGGTIPLTPASYPVTIQLYNNASVNAQFRTQITYGYHIWMAGTGTLYTGISDTIIFNSPGAGHHAPANAPGYSIDGFAGAPAGLFRDAELDLVGDIGGDNAVFHSLSGALNLMYSNSTSGGWKNVPSAYNWGGDTGETSTGIASYWMPNHTEYVNQGPAMLYGLWGAAPWVSVKSGSIHLAGKITPSYGFVFVSNTPAVQDPWVGERDNMSWLPTNSFGAFNTWLPPTGGMWTSRYYVQAFAPGSSELNGTPITGSNPSYNLKLSYSKGPINAPFYMFSNKEASELAMRLTGSPMAPYVFNGLVSNMNFTFDHLNDYGFPTFVLLFSQGVTDPIWVNNTYQGQDSAAGNFYIGDYSPTGSSGILVPGPYLTGDAPFLTSGINIYGGIQDQVTNQVLAGDGYGLQLVLWKDTRAHVSMITSELGASGVWVGESLDTHVWDVSVSLGGNGITDMGSVDTVGWNLAVSGTGSIGVYGLSSMGGVFSTIQVTSGGSGVVTGANFGAGADYDPYYYLPGTTDYTVRGMTVNAGLGANFSLSRDTHVLWLNAGNGSAGVVFDSSSTSYAAHVVAWKNSVGVEIIDSHGAAVSYVVATQHSVGVYIQQSSFVWVNHVLAEYFSTGVWIWMSTNVFVSNVTAIHHSVGVYLQP